MAQALRALRSLSRGLRFDFLMSVRDSSAVSLRNVLQLLDLLPEGRVVVSNEPADGASAAAAAAQAADLMFLASADIARVLAKEGASLRSSGAGDAGPMSLWLRGWAGVRHLRHASWFLRDAAQCGGSTLAVEAASPETWQEAAAAPCRLCLPPASPSPPGPVPAPPGCRWPRLLRDRAAALGGEACRAACAAQAVVNATRRACPPAACRLLCGAPPGGAASAACGSGAGGGSRGSERVLPLAICVFGSGWEDRRLRERLRSALRSCSALAGGAGAPHVFVMPPLPDAGHPLRAAAAEEAVGEGDLDVAPRFEGLHGAARPAYAYTQALHIVEERFGEVEFLLLADHRAYVNVPLLLRAVLPSLRPPGVYTGCFLDETLFNTGGAPDDDSQCLHLSQCRVAYLRRRRAPMFAHGMGFIVSADLALAVADMAAQTPLRSADVAADVSFGMWAQVLEGTSHESLHEAFHEWPRGELADVGVSVEGGGLDVSRPPSGTSMVVWPMTLERWDHFELSTCSLSAGPRRRGPAGLAAPAPPMPGEAPTQVAPRPPGAAGAPPGDCWQGMGGRPQAWYLVCCSLGWERCWGGAYTAESCCRGVPPSTPDAVRPSDAVAVSLEPLRRFLGFGHEQMRLLMDGIDQALEEAAEPLPALGRLACFTPRDCVREAFARLYQRSWATGALPVAAAAGSGGRPVREVQLEAWLAQAARLVDGHVPEGGGCLEWGPAGLARRFFPAYCGTPEVVAVPGGRDATGGAGVAGRPRAAGAEELGAWGVPDGSVGVAVCAHAFERLALPHRAMARLFAALAPGGLVVWAAAMFGEVHESGGDYFRFTIPGAAALGEDAGFEVVGQYGPGGLRELGAALLGAPAGAVRLPALLEDSGSTWSLLSCVLLRKPAAGKNGPGEGSRCSWKRHTVYTGHKSTCATRRVPGRSTGDASGETRPALHGLRREHLQECSPDAASRLSASVQPWGETPGNLDNPVIWFFMEQGFLAASRRYGQALAAELRRLAVRVGRPSCVRWPPPSVGVPGGLAFRWGDVGSARTLGQIGGPGVARAPPASGLSSRGHVPVCGVDPVWVRVGGLGFPMAARAFWAVAQQVSLAGAISVAFDREAGAGHGGGQGRSAAHVGVMSKSGVTRYSARQIRKAHSTQGAFWPDSSSRGNSLYAGAGDLTDNVSWGWHHPNGVFSTIPVGAPLIDSELNIYVGSDDAIRKFDVSGELLWSYAPRGQLAAAPSIAIGSGSRRMAVAPTEVSAEEEAALRPDWAKQGDDPEVPYETFFAQVKVGDRLKVRPGKAFVGDGGKDLYRDGDQGRIAKVIRQGGDDERVVIQWPRTGHESVANLASLGKRFVRVASEVSAATLPPMLVGSTTSGYVFAVGLSDGEEIWATQASEQIAGVKGAVGAKDGVVVVATNRCTDRYCYRYRNQTNPLTPSNSIVRGLSAADGSALWSYKTRSPVWNMVPQWGPNDTVMFQDFEANAYCLNFKTGALVWKFRASKGMGTYTSAAAVYDAASERFFAMGAKEYEHKYCNPYPAPGVLPHCNTWPGSPGMIYGLNATSGRKMWEYETREPPASGAVGFLNSPAGHTRLVVTLGYNCRYNSPTGLLILDPNNGHFRLEREGPTLWSGMCAGDREGGDIRRAMGGRAACVPNSWSSPVIDSNGDFYVGNQVGVLQKWGSPTGRNRDFQVLSTLTTGVAFQDSAIAFGPGIMAVSTCTSLIVMQTSDGDNFTFPLEY
ncbi:unnamed protein product [Prorocentrum cordatum]|nr:unnamed protein product [Polarella glacialis]